MKIFDKKNIFRIAIGIIVLATMMENVNAIGEMSIDTGQTIYISGSPNPVVTYMVTLKTNDPAGSPGKLNISTDDQAIWAEVGDSTPDQQFSSYPFIVSGTPDANGIIAMTFTLFATVDEANEASVNNENHEIRALYQDKNGIIRAMASTAIYASGSAPAVNICTEDPVACSDMTRLTVYQNIDAGSNPGLYALFTGWDTSAICDLRVVDISTGSIVWGPISCTIEQDPKKIYFNGWYPEKIGDNIYRVRAHGSQSAGGLEADIYVTTKPIVTPIEPLSVKITSPNDEAQLGDDEDITFTSQVSGGTPPYKYIWRIFKGMDGTEILSTSDNFNINFYEKFGLAFIKSTQPVGVSIELEVTDANGATKNVGKWIHLISPPTPIISTEIQNRKGKKIERPEMGQQYDFVVKLTNIDKRYHYYNLRMEQVKYNIGSIRTWNDNFKLYYSDLQEKLISPGETKEYRFRFSNSWTWIPEKGINYNFFVGIINTILKESTGKGIYYIIDFMNKFWKIAEMDTPKDKYPIDKVDVDFSPRADSTNSLITSDELKKTVILDIPITNLKKSSYVMSIIWSSAGLASAFFSLYAPPVSWLGIPFSVLMNSNSNAAYDLAYDPSNDFEIIVKPEPIYFPEISAMNDGPEKELLSSTLELSSIYRAYVNSYIRYLGAAEADEPYYMVMQLDSAKNYSTQLIQEMEDIQRLQKVIYNDVLDIDQIKRIQNETEKNGLPETYVNFLTREGLAYLIPSITQEIVNADPKNYTDPRQLFNLSNAITQTFILNSENLTLEVNDIKINQLNYSETNATPEEINDLENLKSTILKGLNEGAPYDELNIQIQLMIEKSNDLLEKTNNISYLAYYTFAIQSLAEHMNSFEAYNITFLPPITTMQTFNLTNGSTLPIKFTVRNITNEFISDNTVSVNITNSTGRLITRLANGTGANNVRIDSMEEQYIVNLHTNDYNLKVGETYAVTVTFGESTSLKGYAITYFTLIEGGKAKGK